MNTHAKFAFGVALGLMMACAFALAKVQSLQRLGVPGVKVVERPVYREDGEVIGTNVVALPEKVLNFESKEFPVAKLVSEWLPKDTVYGQRTYSAPDGFLMHSMVVLMGADRTSIHKPEYCLTGQGFQVQKSERDTVQIQEPHPYSLPVLKMVLRREVPAENGQRITQAGVFVYWFVADQQLTADHNERMRWMARDLITRRLLQRWAYVSCFSVCAPGQEEAAYARIREWIAAAVPQFQLATGPASGLARIP